MSGDLFGFEAPPEDRSATVQLRLIVLDDRRLSWLVTADPMKRGEFLPKSACSRGEGRDAEIFTVPRWMAREKGLL